MARTKYKEYTGYCGIVMYRPKKEQNWGTFTRSAYCFGANFAATIGHRYPYSAADTTKSWRNIPFFHFSDFEEFYRIRPPKCKLIAVDILPEAKDLVNFEHPRQAVYIFGGEDITLPDSVLKKCDTIVSFQSKFCLNVAMAGTLVMYDRQTKLNKILNRG